MKFEQHIPAEIKLILSACFHLEVSSIPTEMNSPLLKSLLRYHGVRPQFFDFLHKNGLEVSFQPNLVQECQQIALFNMLSVNELAKINSLLTSNGVHCFAYKGSLWAYWLYENVGGREFGDIDILVKKSSIQAALSSLETAGYIPDAYRKFLLEEPVRASGFYRTDYHIPLENTTNALSSMVELHWQVAYPRLQFNFPEEEWDRYGKTHVINGNDLHGFVNEYQFLMMVVHHGGKEEWSRIKYIADFAAYMIRYGKETNWTIVSKIAKEKGIYTLLEKSLALLKSLGLPWEDQWPVSTKVVDVSAYISMWIGMPPQAENSTWPYFVNGLAIHDGIQHKSKVLFAHLAYLLEWRLLQDKKRWYDENPA